MHFFLIKNLKQCFRLRCTFFYYIVLNALNLFNYVINYVIYLLLITLFCLNSQNIIKSCIITNYISSYVIINFAYFKL